MEKLKKDPPMPNLNGYGLSVSLQCSFYMCKLLIKNFTIFKDDENLLDETNLETFINYLII